MLVEEVLRGASAMLVELGGSTDQNRLDLSALRIHLGGLIWITLRYLHNQGHVGVEVGDLARIRAKAPELRDKPLMLPVVLVTLQALASTPGASDIFMKWARQEKRENLPRLDYEIVQGPRLQPWNRPELWSFGSFALAIEIVTRFLNQEVPDTETSFANTLGDLFALVGEERWTIEVIVIVLYFVRSTPWFWPTLFRSDLTGF